MAIPGKAGQTVNDYMLDRAVQHQLWVIRHSNANAREVRRLIAAAQEDLIDKLAFRLKMISKRGGVDLGPEVTRRLREVDVQLGQLSREMMRDTRNTLQGSLVELAKQEALYQDSLFIRAFPVVVDTVTPSAATLVSLVTRQPFDGMPLTKWFDKLATGQQSQLLQAVRNSIVQGESIGKLTQRIRGSAASGFTDGVLGGTRRNAEAIARTATLHVSNQTRQAYYLENDEFIKGLQWVATLDTKTCLRCQAQDGRVYPIRGGVRPPLHVQCRCTMTPVLKSAQALGLDLADAPEGTRVSMDGQVPESMTYNKWLAQKLEQGDTRTLNEALGPRRAELFASGNYAVTDFVDVRGRTITLAQLATKDPP